MALRFRASHAATSANAGALKFFFADEQTNLGSLTGRKFFGDRITGRPNHFSLARQNRPAAPGASGNTGFQEQAFKFSNAPTSLRAVRVAWTPISEDQWPLDTIKIKGTPAHYSVALGRRPVNYFQIEAAANFCNHNGSGFPAAGLRNAVGKITIFARRFGILCCLACVDPF